MRRLLFVLLVALFVCAIPTVNAQNPTPPATEPASAPVLKLTGVTAPIHDPTLIKDGDTYYVFATGQGIPIHCSKNRAQSSV